MITDQQWQIYASHRANGVNIAKAARMAAISRSSAQRYEDNHPDHAKYRQAARVARAQPAPLRKHQMTRDAQHALEEFEFFQRRYLGRIGLPWQEDSAQQVVKLLESPDKEYCVINAPPGSGKSTHFTYALPLWLTARDRAIRGLIGSATSKLAAQYTTNIRRALETTLPILADDEDREKGVAVDATATMSQDFGRFKPVDHESWTRDAFIVSQFDNAPITSKEPTWTAVGRDQEFIGGRYDFITWDDVVTMNRLRTIEMIEKDRDWWDSYAERRLEPAGVLLLTGQRQGASDLYRYCLDMTVDEDDDYEDEETDGISLRQGTDGSSRKYHHIIYKAHYEENCKGSATHRRDAEPYPKGCLLSPRRVTWREISTIMRNRPDTFAQVYQQQDVAAEAVLVDPAWITNCWDMDRDRLDIPHNLSAPNYSIASADPSPTRYWGITWWIYNEPSDLRFLIDLERTGLDAPDFLDWNQNQGTFSGLMDEWQQTSRDLGYPISHWIIEANAAQRFLLQYDHVRRWAQKNSVEIIPHTTHRNKTDPNFGVQTIAPHYQFGRVRLPGKVSSVQGVGKGRALTMKLVDEVTRYPQASTDDLVMSQWMFEFQLQYLAMASSNIAPARRPAWLMKVS